MPKVAICIPCYNDLLFMKRLLDSIEIQTYKDFIVIISDDSTNYCIRELIENYTKYKIEYHQNSSNIGPTRNTNLAVSLAGKYQPEYIKIMHHDDYFSFEDSLYELVSLLERDTKADIAFCGTYQVSEENKYSRGITIEQLELLKKDYRTLFIGNYIGAPSATIVRNIGIYMDENLIWQVDVDWYLRILAQNAHFAYTTVPLVSIGVSEKQVTNYCQNHAELMLKEAIYVYKKYKFLQIEKYTEKVIYDTEQFLKMYEIIELCRTAEKLYIYGAGIEGKAFSKLLQNKNIKWEGFIVSDGRKTDDVICEHNVFTLNDIKENLATNSWIVLAMNTKNKNEVMKDLSMIEKLNIIEY